MEEGARFGQFPGAVVKSRNSSGCLIVRKRGDGAGGIGSSGSRVVFQSKAEKKRPRLILSDSGSSDELLLGPSRRRSGPNGSSSTGFEEGIAEESERTRNMVPVRHVRPNSVGGGFDVDGVEIKRSKLDVFEFDESDGSEYLGDRGTEMGGRRFFSSETGSSRHGSFDKPNKSLFETGSLSSEKRSRFEMKRDGVRLSDPLLREKFVNPSDEAIRLQGKNGVLKVMVRKKDKVDGSVKHYNHLKRDADNVKGSSILCSPAFSETKLLKKPSPVARPEKASLNVPKSVSKKKSKARDWDSEGSDTSLKPGSKNLGPCSSIEKRKSKGERTPSPVKLLPTKCMDGKVKRGSGTEKQLLREQIRKMLMNAGWTIDYRPRRNRDYLDAVYINPSGTAYWSIIKAYDALQKQLEDEDTSVNPSGESSAFAPISEDILSKLTRQTRKKIEQEMKKKQRDKARPENLKEAPGRSSGTDRHHTESSDSADQEDKLSSYMRQNGKSLKGKFQEVDFANGGSTPNKIYKGKQDRVLESESHLVVGRKSRKIGRCTLLVRRSSKGQNSDTDDFVPYKGRRTLLSWMIDSGTVKLSEKVLYMNRKRTKTLQEGWITRDGIHCRCCSKIITVSKFEIHAGSKLRQPFQNIFLESGLSLLQCQLKAWNKQEKPERSGFHLVDTDGDDPNDDTCGICGDGGDLICCDGCPSTYHQSCLHIEKLPLGDWHCPSCSCKFCGVADETVAEENGALRKCSLCQGKYHDSCISKTDELPAVSSISPTFCGQKCRELYEHLLKTLGVKHELEAGFSWSFIHRTDPDLDTSFRGFPQRVECNSKLAVALTIMDECFLPIIDRRSGINLIHNVLYNCGSNFSRLDYSGFYTVILERGDEIISAASIRIHGTQLAEMPYIGTRHIYRRQGMCRRLFFAIESALRSLKVERLVIPAISDLMHTWTVVFGFRPLEESHKQQMRSLNMLVFPDTDMLQKPLVMQDMIERNITVDTEAKARKVEDKHCIKPVLGTSSDMDCIKPEPCSCDDASTGHAGDINGKVAAADSGFLAHGTPSNDLSTMSNASDAPSEHKVHKCSDGNVSHGTSATTMNQSAESALGGMLLSSSCVDDNILEMERPILDSNIKGASLPPAKNEVGNTPEENVVATCLVPLVFPVIVSENCAGITENNAGETNQIDIPVSTSDHVGENLVQLEKKNHKAISVSTSPNTDDSTARLNSDLPRIASKMEINSHVALQDFSDADSFRHASPTKNIAGETILPVSTSHGVDESMVDLNETHQIDVFVCTVPSQDESMLQPDIGMCQNASYLESKFHATAQAFSNEMDCEENISHAFVSDSTFGSVDESMMQIEEMNQKVVSVSICCGRNPLEVECKSHVASQTSSDATRCEETTIDGYGTENIAEETNQMIVAVSTLHSDDDGTVRPDKTNQKAVTTFPNSEEIKAQLDFDLHYHNAAEMGSKSQVVSPVSSVARHSENSVGPHKKQNAIPDSILHSGNVLTQLNADLHNPNTSEIESKSHAALQASSDAMHGEESILIACCASAGTTTGETN